MERPSPSFGQSLGKLIVFQFKLAADALRDFLLSPLSILMFILDLIFRPKNSFYDRLMRIGRRSDEIINLFEQHSPAPEGDETTENPGSSTTARSEKKP